MKLTFGLIDNHFAHDNFMVAGIDSRLLAWDRATPFLHEYVAFSHEMMFSQDRFRLPLQSRIGLLFESRAIVPEVYKRVGAVADDFNLIFTHDEETLKKIKNARWIPGSGVWIGGRHAPGERGIHRKDRMVSLLTSSKLKCPLHLMRYSTALRLKKFHPLVKVYIQGLDFRDRISPFETLSRYRYSIVMENFVGKGYFTEKILNCFATGTVPIYLGSPDIGRYFNSDGILTFRSYRDLVKNVLPNIGPLDFRNRSSAIRDNLRKSSRYGAIEDFIIDNYLEELTRANSTRS